MRWPPRRLTQTREEPDQPELLAKVNEAMRERGLLKDGESCTGYSPASSGTVPAK